MDQVEGDTVPAEQNGHAPRGKRADNQALAHRLQQDQPAQLEWGKGRVVIDTRIRVKI